MQEDDILKRLLKKGAITEASPGLEDSIMRSIEQLAASPHPAPAINLRAFGLFAGMVTLLAVVAVAIGIFYGEQLQLAYLLEVPAVSVKQLNTLILSLAAFWVLLFFNYFLKNRLGKRHA